MKTISVILASALLLSLSGCAGTATQLVNETDSLIRKSVYATDDSLQARRYDLAKKYSAQSVRLVAPPDAKERIKVTPITQRNSPSKIKPVKKDKNNSGVFDSSSPDFKTIDPSVSQPSEAPISDVPIVILPKEDQGAVVVIEDSPQYKNLEASNAQFKRENDNLKKDQGNLKTNIDRLLVKKAEYERAQALKEQTTHWYSHIFSFFRWFFGLSGLFVGIVIIGLIVLCVVNPVLGGLVIGVIAKVFKAIGLVFQGVFWVLGGILTFILALFNKKPKPPGSSGSVPPTPPAPP